MNALATKRVEELFSSLTRDEKVNIISHGVALRLTELHKRLDMAERRIHKLEEKYGKSLKELKTHQLPDDADYEMHEEYVMWNHWVETVDSLQERIDSLSEIMDSFPHHKHVSRQNNIVSSDETCLEDVMEYVLSNIDH